jgi:hypothetical protein
VARGGKQAELIAMHGSIIIMNTVMIVKDS